MPQDQSNLPGGPAGGPVPISGANVPAPASPTQQPAFFKTLLFALGKGLLEGTRAGLEAPRNAQGPAVAAQNAPNIPLQDAQRRQAMRQIGTSQQLDDMNVAITQLKLHQLQMVTAKMDEDRQNEVYNKGRDTLGDLLEKGKVDVLATGDMQSVQDEFVKRQADAKAGGQGLLPIQILPAAGSSAKDPQYSLVMVGKDKLTADMDETWGAADLGLNEKDFGAAGLTPFKFHASAGMDQQKALQLKTTQYLNWLTKSENQLGAWKRAQLTSSDKAKDRDMRWNITKANNENRRIVAQIKQAQSSDDKELLQALNEKKTHIDKLAKLSQDTNKIANWIDLSGGQKQAIQQEQDAIDAADQRISALSGNKSKPSAGFQVPAGAPAPPKEDGKVLKMNGAVVAKSQGGKWVAPQ